MLLSLGSSEMLKKLEINSILQKQDTISQPLDLPKIKTINRMQQSLLKVLMLFFVGTINAQLPIVYGEGGIEVIDWTKEKKRVELNEDDNPFLYGSGCTEGPQKASASSTLASQGAANYKAENLVDWDPQTAWIEGKNDYGIGVHFQVDLPFGGSNVGVFNGYQQSYETWKNNSRVKKIKIFGDGRPLCYVILQDLMGYQTFTIPEDKEYRRYRFEIEEVYPGLTTKDVAISEICNIGCCFNENTFIQANEHLLQSENLKKGALILTLDPDSLKITEHEISKVIQMKHSKMIRVSTQNHSIEITPYHPLYIKDKGFTSILKLKKEQNIDRYEKLTKDLWVLVLSENDKTLKFEKIETIELLFGEFNTYSILDIKEANTYIMNGFVSTTHSTNKVVLRGQ